MAQSLLRHGNPGALLHPEFHVVGPACNSERAAGSFGISGPIIKGLFSKDFQARSRQDGVAEGL